MNKYDIDDKVYYINANKVMSGVVDRISVDIFRHKTHTLYVVKSDLISKLTLSLEEERLSGSAEELVGKLLEDVGLELEAPFKKKKEIREGHTMNKLKDNRWKD